MLTASSALPCTHVLVMSTSEISPFFIRSAGLGRPSWILSTDSHGTPAARSAWAVPAAGQGGGVQVGVGEWDAERH